MEGEQASKNKDLKIEVPSESGAVPPGGLELAETPTSTTGAPTLTRQSSVTKTSCLCAPTTHAGSFRCRLHRAPSLQRTKSIDYASVQDSAAKPSSASTNS